MDRRQFLKTLAAPALAAAQQRPNIILILADDMGFSDLGCYGSEIATPNLDALAARGTRFTQFYNNARCCPTRASLLTGLYPHQTGIGYMEPVNRFNKAIIDKVPSPQYQGFLNKSCTTIAEALKPAGYQTFMTGKWHVGAQPGQRPCDRGFDRYYGILNGASSYWKPAPANLHHNNEPVRDLPKDFYTTDYFANYAARFIYEADAAKPFFLYLAFNAPHWPLEAWPEDIARYRGKYNIGWDELRRRRFARQKELGLFPPNIELAPRDPDSFPWETASNKDNFELRMAVYAAMIDRMDQAIGRVLEAVRRKGQQDNTLILFLSDNGACAEPYQRNANNGDNHAAQLLPWANASNTPFRLFKHWIHEGGITTPFIASWPGRIPAGKINRTYSGHLIDILPTLLDAAGAQPPAPLEGVSLLPALTNSRLTRKQPIYWEHEGNRGLREGKWKLVSYYNEIHEEIGKVGTGKRTGQWELYDIENDRTELHNLAAKHPDRVKAMAARHRAWEQRVGVMDWEKATAHFE